MNNAETKQILDDFGVKNYTINDDLTVDVVGNVEISGKGLTKIPVKFGKVTGSFRCQFNILASLEGSPELVGGGFYCYNNNLTTLEGSPKEVGRKFWYYNNPLPSNIKNPEYPNITRYELEKNHLIWQNGKYRVFDNIFCEVLSQKNNVYKVKIKGNTAYVIDNGVCFSHGETIEEARWGIKDEQFYIFNSR